MTNETPPVEICQCGCGGPLLPAKGYGRKPRRYLPGHNSRVPEVKAKQAAARRRWHDAGRPPLPTYICQCGCGEVIPPSRVHRYRPPRYILGHYLRLGTSSRMEASRAAKLEARAAPPEGWVPPSGWCECGCGAPTPVAKTSRPDRGQYTGYPLRFVHGHNARVLTPEQTSGWKGGVRGIDQYGYVAIHRPDYPGARADGSVLVHRMVYEESRGVRLPPGILVHHVNGDKSDNRPENLVAFTRVEHKRAHRLANAIISLFLDDRLLEAAKAHVREHGSLPDLEALTAQVYGRE